MEFLHNIPNFITEFRETLSLFYKQETVTMLEHPSKNNHMFNEIETIYALKI